MDGDLGRAAIFHALAQHLEITAVALVIAVLIGIPLGIHIARERFLAGRYVRRPIRHLVPKKF